METTSKMHPALRALIATGLILAGGTAALFAWFWGIILYTGCFISCSDPNIAAGIGLVAVAAGLVGICIAAGGFAFHGYQRGLMRKLWTIGATAGAILGFGTLIFS